MAHLLGAEALHLEYPTRVVFDSVTLGIEEGDRIGIVGRNGEPPRKQVNLGLETIGNRLLEHDVLCRRA